MKVVSASVLTAYFSQYPEYVLNLQGVLLQHENFGKGQITELRLRDNSPPLLYVCFEQKPELFRKFTIESLNSSKILLIEISEHLAEDLQTWAQAQAAKKLEDERQAIQHPEQTAESELERQSLTALNTLTQKYELPDPELVSQALRPRLRSILNRLQRQLDISSGDLSWAKQQGFWGVLAHCHLNRYRLHNDYWGLAKASKYFRKAGASAQAIEVTDVSLKPPFVEARCASAVLTSRGGAFRDLFQLKAAQTCAEQALEFEPDSPHAYSLLGAIAYEEGRPELGDRYFDLALKYGASASELDTLLQTVIQRSRGAVRSKLEKHLKQKSQLQSYKKKR